MPIEELRLSGETLYSVQHNQLFQSHDGKLLAREKAVNDMSLFPISEEENKDLAAEGKFELHRQHLRYTLFIYSAK
ncbi:hypothetical protein CW304_12445 [Bacillus sp. UFRGS-B20]|nr:hypothetical protein CW304_12445 [Bacillus sp. UFRGS-B20]